MRPHHELRVWQDAMVMVRRVYQVSAEFPPDERFGLTAQMRRSAVSVPSNIAEGAARGSRKEFARFLRMARGSLSELETQLRIAKDLGVGTVDDLLRSIDTLFAMLAGLIRAQDNSDESTDASRAAQPRPDEAARRPT